MVVNIAGLSPLEAAILYWRGLEAPATHVAFRLRRPVEEIAAANRRLAERGTPSPSEIFADLAGYPSSTPWERRTLGELIRRGLDRPRDEIFAYVGDQGALTVEEVRSGVVRIAAGLAAAGVGPGERVAIDATQRLESLLLMLATLLSGAAVVRITFANGPDALRTMIEASPARLTFTAAGPALVGLAAAGQVIDIGSVDEPAEAFEAWLAGCPEPAGDDLPVVPVSPADVALVGFTSGSTGTPKCVLTPHEAVYHSTEAVQSLFGFGADDLFASSTEATALSAFRSLVTLPLLSGGRVLLPSAMALTQPLALAEDCGAFGVTRLTAVPNVLRGMAKAADRIDIGALARLRTVFSGSGVLDQGTRDLFFAAFGVHVIDYYSGREFGTVIYAWPDTSRTISSAGGQVLNCLVRIIDEAGRALPRGEVGEVIVHTDTLTLSPLAGTHADWIGWHQTGDLGVLHPDGRLQIVGRSRDVIKGADGSLIFPAEIESRLNTLDWVAESCVLGWTREGEAERVIAVLILKHPVPDYETLARQHILDLCGQYRMPARVFAFDEFPRVGTGKPDKPSLRKLLEPALDRETI